MDVRKCEELPCPGALSGATQYSQWGSWSQCTAVCNRGTRSRSRSCPSVNACPGPSYEQTYCNEQPCSTNNAGIGAWSQW